MPNMLDNNGFLINTMDWNRDFAIARSKEFDIPLSNKHWDILFELRKNFNEHMSPPTLRLLCHTFDEENLCVSQYFKNALVAWKIAGLPDPGEEARTYMSNMPSNN